MLLYIRQEHFKNEKRTPLVPNDIQTLIEAGYNIVIQESNYRIYTKKEFSDCSGLFFTEKEWYDSLFQNALILGLKELKDLHYLNCHRHLYFSHSFKQQIGGKDILKAFSKSNSILYDIEYLVDSAGERVISFGYYAGLVGAIIGLQQYNTSLESLKEWNSFEEMVNSVGIVCRKPKIAVLGAKGRCGSGVRAILDLFHLSYDCIYKTDSTKYLTTYDIVYNCIVLDPSYTEIWFNESTIPDHPLTIVDISCDYTKPNNPIPIYSKATTWSEPVYTPFPNVNIIAIENLPSLLPRESSIHFSKRLTELLLDFKEDSNQIWQRSLAIFNEKLKEVNQELK